MKTKSNPMYKVIVRTLSMLLTALLFQAIFLLCPIGAAAAQNTDFIVENYNLTERYSSMLSSECASYSSMDTDPQKQTSKSVLAAINIYRKDLLDLQSHPDAANRLLSAEVSLAYSKGLAAGRVAWIYHYNLASLKEESSLARVGEEYSACLEKISSAADADMLDAHADVMCRELNSSIYREMIAELAAEDDSLASSSIIAGGLSMLGEISSDDLFAREHAELYESVKKSLHLQRTRDKLSADLKIIFEITHPEEDLSSNSAVALFTYKIKNAESVAQMNSAMLELIGSLISTEREEVYSFLFLQKLLAELGEECAKASKDERAAELLPLFSDYRKELSRAQIKDAIRALTLGVDENDAELRDIERFYNAEGGALDMAVDSSDFELELVRARYSVNVYLSKLKADSEIPIVLGKYDAAAFLERASKLYSASRSNLEKLDHSPSFAKACEAEFQSFAELLDAIVREAKAERFLLDHRSIISKPADSLSIEDELAARHALDDYTKLEGRVAQALSSQIESICAKYCAILSQKISSLMKDDALYQDLCEKIYRELGELERDNVALFYGECELVLKKADALAKGVAHYREFCADELYESYNASEREDLVEVCRELSEKLCELDVKDTVIFEEELGAIESDAKLDMARIGEIARLRISSRGSANTEIKAILAEAKAKILASYDKGEILLLSQKAIFKINRLLCAEEIETRAKESKYRIDSMKFLKEDEKKLFFGRIDSLAAEAKKDALVAENLTVLSFIWENFSQSLKKEDRESASLELERSRQSYLSLVDEEVEKLRKELRGMIYLKADECDDFLNKTAAILTSLKADIALAQSPEESEGLYRASLDNIHILKLEAEGRNLNNHKLSIADVLESMLNCKNEYSDENYNKVVAVIESAKDKITEAGSISECAEILKTAEREIEAISNLLDEAKQKAIALISAKHKELLQSSYLYSQSAIVELEKILDASLRQINAFAGIESVAELERILELRIAELFSVRRDCVTNSPSGLDFISLGAQYPLNHDTSKELWGLVMIPSSIRADSSLSITPLPRSELDEAQRLIREALKRQKVSFYGGELSGEELDMLKKAKVALGVDIELSNLPAILSPFNLQLLLPASMSSEKILGVAFLRDDNSVEFYNVSQRDLLISLDLSHFSKYYIVSESTTDLTPLIIFLSILIGIEFATLTVLLVIRFRRNRTKKRKEDDMFPMICASFVNPLSFFSFFSLTKLKPEGAITTLVLLSVAALAAGCAIAILLKAELGERRAQRSRGRNAARGDGQYSYPEEQKKLASARRPLLAQKRYRLEAPKEEKNYYPEERGDAEQSEQEVLCAVSHTDSKSEAGFAFAQVEQIFSEEHPTPRPSQHRSKYELNLDVIAEAFDDGDLVTLDALKRKRLIPKKTDHLKILARGALSKQLIIEAHDFSRAAEDMLFALGGRAIRIKDREE